MTLTLAYFIFIPLIFLSFLISPFSTVAHLICAQRALCVLLSLYRLFIYIHTALYFIRCGFCSNIYSFTSVPVHLFELPLIENETFAVPMYAHQLEMRKKVDFQTEWSDLNNLNTDYDVEIITQFFPQFFSISLKFVRTFKCTITVGRCIFFSLSFSVNKCIDFCTHFCSFFYNFVNLKVNICVFHVLDISSVRFFHFFSILYAITEFLKSKATVLIVVCSILLKMLF